MKDAAIKKKNFLTPLAMYSTTRQNGVFFFHHTSTPRAAGDVSSQSITPQLSVADCFAGRCPRTGGLPALRRALSLRWRSGSTIRVVKN